jgi:hypothetical protein
VGDDQEITILKADGDTVSRAGSILLTMTDVRFTTPIPVSTPSRNGNRRRADLTDSLPARSDRRSAYLQCFLF